eukprot:scaffold267504_cov19-Tisochrysis_lutea.AAC.2
MSLKESMIHTRASIERAKHSSHSEPPYELLELHFARNKPDNKACATRGEGDAGPKPSSTTDAEVERGSSSQKQGDQASLQLLRQRMAEEWQVYTAIGVSTHVWGACVRRALMHADRCRRRRRRRERRTTMTS